MKTKYCSFRNLTKMIRVFFNDVDDDSVVVTEVASSPNVKDVLTVPLDSSELKKIDILKIEIVYGEFLDAELCFLVV